ncbi:olfactory receptor 10P1-like [Macrochelys suwanniensis]
MIQLENEGGRGKYQAISFLGCAAQMYFFLLFSSSECCLLAVMSYDRYVTICNPMRYSLIISRKVTISLAAVVWISALPLFYTVSTPTFNPIIYSLRNKEIKVALRKLLGRKKIRIS